MPASRPDLILHTKLRRPAAVAGLVDRRRLIESLARATEVPLTLVSAPAGYGKSVLAGQWVDQLGQPAAWISLDEFDADLRTFLEYFVAAVDAVSPAACPATRELLATPDLPSIPVLAAELIGDLDEIGGPCPIVLDDYHALARTSPVHALVAQLLAHPPQNLHLILLTRRDPPLQLSRLRASGQVVEVRLQDLRFTAEEAAEFLRAALNLPPSAAALSSLQAKIEGWAAGLRLASLALRGTADPDGFLTRLDGSFARTRDYLMDEVMAALQPEVRRWMLRSSILNRFCPDLLDALCDPGSGAGGTDHSTARDFVDLLRQSSLFVIHLDANGEWHRYHHLFRDLLQRLLRQAEAPEVIEDLHARASRWYESCGMITESIQHALVSGAPEDAAGIIERRRQAELDRDRWLVVEGWLALVPDDIKDHHPQLLLAQAWVTFYRLQLPRMAWLVEQLEPLLEGETTEPLWLAELCFFRGVLSYWDGEGEASARSCERGLEFFPSLQSVRSGETRLYLALAQQMTGEGTSASESLRGLTRAVDPTDYAFLSRIVAARVFVHLLSGDLAPAASCARQLRVVARNWKSAYAETWGRYTEGITQLQSFDLDAAMQSFRWAADNRHIFERRAAVDNLAGLALSRQLGPDPDSAMDAVQELIAFASDLGDPENLAVAESCRARILVARGELEPAVEWARSAEVEVHVPGMLFWIEDAALTLARVRIAEGSRQSLGEALEFLGALRTRTEALHRTVHAIEVYVLEALGLERLDRAEEARISVRRALAVAGPRGWIRPFVEAGPAMASMLRDFAARGPGQDFVRRTVAALERRGARPAEADVPVDDGSPSSGTDRLDVDTLTNREVDVLELLAQRLQNTEIAARLFISDHTVSDHLKHIYQKLHVHNRRQAVTRAREMGVLRSRPARSTEPD